MQSFLHLNMNESTYYVPTAPPPPPGPNSKATILRQGLAEMRGISKDLYPTVRDETFFEACGLGEC